LVIALRQSNRCASWQITDFAMFYLKINCRKCDKVVLAGGDDDNRRPALALMARLPSSCYTISPTLTSIGLTLHTKFLSSSERMAIWHWRKN
jgi:hypothetical protein